MADGRHCPACGRAVGVWPVFTAGLPNRIWCPHCRARLAYARSSGVAFVALMAFAGATAGAVYVMTAEPDVDRLWVGAVLLAVAVVVEAVATWYLRRNRVFVRIGEPPGGATAS